jgi:hypothetical protein
MVSVRLTFLLLLLALSACHDKTGLVSRSIQPVTTLAYYYEAEETLFVFYSLQKPENFKPEGALEWSEFRRDQPDEWHDLAAGNWVHPHRTESCDERLFCSSFSVNLKNQPSLIRLRYRYDEAGQDSDVFHIPVMSMKAPRRSFLLFGSFAADQRSVIWEGRHQFPDLTQEGVARFGLTRNFTVNETYALPLTLAPDALNPTLYGSVASCPGLRLDQTGWSGSSAGPLWMPRLVPDEETTPYSGVCATTVVTSGQGPYEAVAFARKNPRVDPLPGKLNIRVGEAQPVNLVLVPCLTPEDSEYLGFQMQQMQMPANTQRICWDSADFGPSWQSYLNRVMSENPALPKYLRVVWHHALEGKKRLPLEGALDGLLAQLYQSFPKLAGTFLYDSSLRATRNPELFRSTVWCRLASTDEFDESDYCGLLLSKQNMDPVTSLDINLFPTMAEFHGSSGFKDNTVDEMRIYAPLRTEGVRVLPFSSGVNPGYFGTFYTGDLLDLRATDRLSYCNKRDKVGTFAFITEPDVDQPSIMPYGSILSLPENHARRNKDQTYNIGMAWTNPFLVALDVRQKIRVNAIAKFILNIPDAMHTQQAFGESLWYEGSYSYDSVLTRCSRYCEHPAYDATGIYHYESTWIRDYSTSCYEPKIPAAPALVGG